MPGSLSKLPLANSLLRKFADDQKADEDFHDAGVQLCEQVSRHLQSEARESSKPFSINSVYYGGSIGKHTDVKKPDFDVVMKINKQQPPFKEVLDFFQRTLTLNASKLNINPESIRTTPDSIQFTFKNGIEVDLLPAATSHTEEEILQKMKKLPPQKRRYYSSSLVERQVEFMKRQDAFTHDVVRLAKVWLKSMDFGETDVCGGSTIFEALAVAAVLEDRRGGHETGGGSDSMAGAFGRVVDYVEKLDKLQLVLEKNYNGLWNVKHGSSVGLQRIPYLLEPSNPNNNLLETMKPSVIDVFKKNGRIMQDRMDQLLKGNTFWEKNSSNDDVINFDKLFETA